MKRHFLLVIFLYIVVPIPAAAITIDFSELGIAGGSVSTTIPLGIQYEAQGISFQNALRGYDNRANDARQGSVDSFILGSDELWNPTYFQFTDPVTFLELSLMQLTDSDIYIRAFPTRFTSSSGPVPEYIDFQILANGSLRNLAYSLDFTQPIMTVGFSSREDFNFHMRFGIDSVSFSQIPEPGTFTLTVIGLLTVFFGRARVLRGGVHI